MQGLWRPQAWGEVDVDVELLDWRTPTEPAAAVRLFDIPMAQQRYAFVLGVIRQHSAQSVVDLGCGEGKLLEYLLQQVMRRGAVPCTPTCSCTSRRVRTISGVDKTISVLSAAADTSSGGGQGVLHF